jgi:predicted nuclease of restriction endonuclease-like RecB superfamily
VFAIIFEEVIAQAMILAEQDRDFAQKIATILAQPFLTYAYNITRVDAQVALADLLPLPERIKIYESLEPYPLWDRDYLRRRREAYREAKHRLFRQAVADYERFRSEN